MSRELKRQLDQLDSAGLLELVVAAATRLEQLSSTVSKQQPPAEDEPSGSGNATTATRRSCGRSSGAICLRRKFKKKQHWLTVVPPVRSLVAGTPDSL